MVVAPRRFRRNGVLAILRARAERLVLAVRQQRADRAVQPERGVLRLVARPRAEPRPPQQTGRFGQPERPGIDGKAHRRTLAVRTGLRQSLGKGGFAGSRLAHGLDLARRRQQALRRERRGRDISVEIGDGEFFSLLGPSGCGKTTTLRMIAGFEAPDGGASSYSGRTSPRRREPPPAEHGVPAVRALPAHVDLRQRRVRAEGEGVPRAEHKPADRRDPPRCRAGGLERRKPRSSPAASSSAWRWRARSSTGRPRCCSTSRSARST